MEKYIISSECPAVNSLLMIPNSEQFSKVSLALQHSCHPFHRQFDPHPLKGGEQRDINHAIGWKRHQKAFVVWNLK